MTTKNHLTEKKLSDRRFARTEEKILETYIKHQESNISKLSKKAKISRMTFYRHHKNTFSIISDNEKHLQRKFKKYIRPFVKRKNVSFRSVYRNTLCFILRNKKLFKTLANKNETRIFQIVTEELRLKFEKFARLPKNAERISEVYSGEIVAILSKWCENDFAETDLDQVLNDIIYLSETARIRLMPLVH